MSEDKITYIDDQNSLHVLSAEIFKLFGEYREVWLETNAPDELIWVYNDIDKSIVSYNINFNMMEQEQVNGDDVVIDSNGEVIEGVGKLSDLEAGVREKLGAFNKNSYEGYPKKLVKKLKDLDEQKEKLITGWKF